MHEDIPNSDKSTNSAHKYREKNVLFGILSGNHEKKKEPTISLSFHVSLQFNQIWTEPDTSMISIKSKIENMYYSLKYAFLHVDFNVSKNKTYWRDTDFSRKLKENQ